MILVGRCSSEFCIAFYRYALILNRLASTRNFTCSLKMTKMCFSSVTVPLRVFSLLRKRQHDFANWKSVGGWQARLAYVRGRFSAMYREGCSSFLTFLRRCLRRLHLICVLFILLEIWCFFASILPIPLTSLPQTLFLETVLRSLRAGMCVGCLVSRARVKAGTEFQTESEWSCLEDETSLLDL